LPRRRRRRSLPLVKRPVRRDRRTAFARSVTGFFRRRRRRGAERRARTRFVLRWATAGAAATGFFRRLRRRRRARFGWRAAGVAATATGFRPRRRRRFDPRFMKRPFLFLGGIRLATVGFSSFEATLTAMAAFDETGFGLRDLNCCRIRSHALVCRIMVSRNSNCQRQGFMNPS